MIGSLDEDHLEGASAATPAASGPTTAFTPEIPAAASAVSATPISSSSSSATTWAPSLANMPSRSKSRRRCAGPFYPRRARRPATSGRRGPGKREAELAGRFDPADLEMPVAIGEGLGGSGKKPFAGARRKQRGAADGSLRRADLIVDHAAAEICEIEHGVLLPATRGFFSGLQAKGKHGACSSEGAARRARGSREHTLQGIGREM